MSLSSSSVRVMATRRLQGERGKEPGSGTKDGSQRKGKTQEWERVVREKHVEYFHGVSDGVNTSFVSRGNWKVAEIVDEVEGPVRTISLD